VPAIISELTRISPALSKLKTARDIAEAAKTNPIVTNVLDRVSERMAQVLTPVVAALDPGRVMLGSPDPAFSQLLGEPLQRHMRSELLGLTASQVVVEPADSLLECTLKGAGGLVVSEFLQRGGDLQMGSQDQDADEGDGTALRAG